jgi:hypothetical protein
MCGSSASSKHPRFSLAEVGGKVQVRFEFKHLRVSLAEVRGNGHVPCEFKPPRFSLSVRVQYPGFIDVPLSSLYVRWLQLQIQTWKQTRLKHPKCRKYGPSVINVFTTFRFLHFRFASRRTARSKLETNSFEKPPTNPGLSTGFTDLPLRSRPHFVRLEFGGLVLLRTARSKLETNRFATPQSARNPGPSVSNGFTDVPLRSL